MATCPCCCPDKKACWQQWSSTYECYTGLWGAPVPGAKRCLESGLFSPNPPHSTWEVPLLNTDRCTALIDVTLGHCCTSDGDCTGYADTATPAPPDFTPEGCCKPCDGCATTCDYMRLTLNFTACSGCFTTSGTSGGINGSGNPFDFEWTNASNFNVAICVPRAVAQDCIWEITVPGQLIEYASSDGTCDPAAVVLDDLKISVGRTTVLGVPGWNAQVEIGGRVLFTGFIAAADCTSTAIIPNIPYAGGADYNVGCPDGGIEAGGTITVEPCSCTPP